MRNELATLSIHLLFFTLLLRQMYRSIIYSSPQKSRFFYAFDHKEPEQTLLDICLQDSDFPSLSTASRWLRDRRLHGQKSAERRSQKAGRTKRGRPRIDTSSTTAKMASGSKRIREQNYEYFETQAHVSRSTLMRRLHEEKIVRGIEPIIKKISPNNKTQRVQFGYRHHDKPLSYWQSIHWTDEIHFNNVLPSKRRIFRKEGTRTEPENMLDIPPSNATFHIAAMVSWHNKTDLIFYHNEHERDKVIVQDWKRQKPRRSKYESEQEWLKRIKDWEAKQPPDVQVEPQGNSMTQDYYVNTILPHYKKELEHQKSLGRPALLQEDNDNSHGTRSQVNVVKDYKIQHGIECHAHPAQSPDLNPIEGVWLILKQRVKQRYLYGSMEELQQIIQEEWQAIDQSDIQVRIAEMPYRCHLLTQNGGERIRRTMW